MRLILTILIVAAAALVALWQLDVLQLPFQQQTVAQVAGTGLFEAARTGDLEVLQTRLTEGANADARDGFGQTPLMYAAGGTGSLETMETLVDAGADVQAQTDAGWTALMYAARDATTPEPVLWLLNAGADPTVRNAEGQSAADIAESNSAVRNSGLYRRLSELTSRPFERGWPSGYVVPVDGATISSRATHLPGAARAYRNGTHEGFDFYDGTVSVEIEYGTPIQAVAMGTVVRADTEYEELTMEAYEDVIDTARNSLSTPPEILDRLRGRQVWIRHPGGFISRYAHLSGIAPEVVVGTEVGQGQEIGATGNSGTLEAASGTQADPHPHVEIWRDEDTYLGLGMEPQRIYALAAQVFGTNALPPFTGQ